jgi:stage V sporulation protein B
MKKYLKYKNPWKKAYLYPLIASIPMGVTAGVVYYGLYHLIHSNFICLCIAIVFAAAVFFLVYLVASKPTRHDLAVLPGGNILYKVGKKLKLC